MQVTAIIAVRVVFCFFGARHTMPREVEVLSGTCERHGKNHPCTCAMGNIYRFVEPVVLLMLKEKKHSYGYDLTNTLADYALTDAEIEGAALYRTLRPSGSQ